MLKKDTLLVDREGGDLDNCSFNRWDVDRERLISGDRKPTETDVDLERFSTYITSSKSKQRNHLKPVVAPHAMFVVVVLVVVIVIFASAAPVLAVCQTYPSFLGIALAAVSQTFSSLRRIVLAAF